MTKVKQICTPLRTFPTNTVLQTRLGFFAPGLNRPPENDSRIKYLYEMKNDYGIIAVRNVCLTQIHAKVLRALCNPAYQYQENGDGTYTQTISAQKLLQTLHWPCEKDYYLRLLKVLDDLHSVSIYIESYKGSMKGGSIHNYHVIESYGVNEKDPVGNWKLKINISSEFAKLCDTDLNMIYPELSEKISYLQNGLVESIVNFLLSQSLSCSIKQNQETKHFEGWKGTLKDILNCLCYTTEHDNPLTEKKYTEQSIRDYLIDLRPIWNPDTHLYEDSPAVKDLRENFEIHVNWNGNRTEHCEVYYDKSALEKKHKDGEVPYQIPVRFQKYKKVAYTKRISFDPDKLPATKKSNFVPITDPEESVVFKRIEKQMFHADPFGD